MDAAEAGGAQAAVASERRGEGGAELALGTVQLGLAYGAANVTGMPTEDQAVAIVCAAAAAGVPSLDTAHGYELSQHRLGVALRRLEAAGNSSPRVVTKLDTSIADAATPKEVAQIVDASVANSRGKLGLNPLHTVLLHTWHGHGPSLHDGAAYTRLKELKAAGAIERIGTSTYFPSDVLEAVADPDTDHVQLPFNLLDYRWREAGVPVHIAKRPDVVVHARSCFLQGILVADKTDCWPARFGREVAKDVVAAMSTLVAQLGRRNKVDLCLAYARAQPWISEVVVGAETMEQLKELLDLRDTLPLTAEEVRKVEGTMPRVPADLLNPATWHDEPSFAGSFATGLLGPE